MKTAEEIKQMVELAIEKYEDDYTFIGIRFEDKERQVGEIIEEESRHNDDREDVREFPEFGTEEYDEMETLGGISAWHLPDFERENGIYGQGGYFTKHAYIIVSDESVWSDDVILDDNEVVLVNAEVAEIVF